MLTRENYISANVDCVAENCIKFLLWRERSVMDTINYSAEHAANYFPGIQADFTAAVIESLTRATKDAKSFNAFINKRRETLVRPYMKSAKEYIANILETPFSAGQIISIVRRDMGI